MAGSGRDIAETHDSTAETINTGAILELSGHDILINIFTTFFIFPSDFIASNVVSDIGKQNCEKRKFRVHTTHKPSL
jgi:hypothetical protein